MKVEETNDNLGARASNSNLARIERIQEQQLGEKL